MAWIEVVDPDEWTGPLAKIKPTLTDPATGSVDNILSIHSLDAGSLQAHVALYQQAMKGTDSLPKAEREMIALVVSKLNGCHY